MAIPFNIDLIPTVDNPRNNNTDEFNNIWNNFIPIIQRPRRPWESEPLDPSEIEEPDEDPGETPDDE
jgi:hypothetical protein